MTSEELIRRWGNIDSFVRYNPAVVADLKIPESSKTLLIEAGLPTSGFSFLFDVDDPNLPRISERFPQARDVNSDICDLPIIGISPFSSTYFYLDEANQGAVMAVYFQVNHVGKLCSSTEFVNSSVEHYAEYVCLFKEYYDRKTKEKPDIEEDEQWHMYSRDLARR